MTNSNELASGWRRLLALIYDTLIVVAILILASAVGTGIAAMIYGSDALTDQHVLDENPFFFGWLLFCWFYYYFYCWTKSGQTLAMKTWHIQLVTQSGTEITMGQALIRFFTGFLGLANITAILPNRWALHDYLSGTQMIILPKGQ